MTHILFELLLAFSLKTMKCSDYNLLPENQDDIMLLELFHSWSLKLYPIFISKYFRFMIIQKYLSIISNQPSGYNLIDKRIYKVIERLQMNLFIAKGNNY